MYICEATGAPSSPGIAPALAYQWVGTAAGFSATAACEHGQQTVGHPLAIGCQSCILVLAKEPNLALLALRTSNSDLAEYKRKATLYLHSATQEVFYFLALLVCLREPDMNAIAVIFFFAGAASAARLTGVGGSSCTGTRKRYMIRFFRIVTWYHIQLCRGSAVPTEDMPTGNVMPSVGRTPFWVHSCTTASLACIF